MEKNKETENNAYQKTAETPLVLDFIDLKYLGEIHLLLKQKFGLPEYYGANWDALWDCLDGLFDEAYPMHVDVYHVKRLPKDVREECEKMFGIFGELAEKTPYFTFRKIS